MSDSWWHLVNDLPATGTSGRWGQDDRWEVEAGVVRPYLLTRGRTHTGGRQLPVEAMIRTTVLGRTAAGRLPAETRNIVDLCHTPLSLAEVAAKLRSPIGVIRVLVADLAEGELVDVHDGADEVEADLHLLQRLIARVQAIPV